MDKKTLTKIKKTTEELFKKISIAVEAEVLENESGVKVEIETEDSALLIGYHGETLKSIEHLLRQLTQKASDEFFRLSIDISGYRAKEDFKLSEIARKVARRVENSGRPEELEPMDANKRRLVHLAMRSVSGVVAESIGDELERRILIRPK